MSSLACCPVIWVCEGNRAFLHQALSLSSATLLTNNHALQAATCSDSSAIRAEALRQTQWNDKHLWLALCSCPENWWLLSPGSGRTATDQGQLCPRSVPESARVCPRVGPCLCGERHSDTASIPRQRERAGLTSYASLISSAHM